MIIYFYIHGFHKITWDNGIIWFKHIKIDSINGIIVFDISFDVDWILLIIDVICGKIVYNDFERVTF